MATFRSVVLGQPEIASIVFGYQTGVYEDVRPAFIACEELVEFDASKKLYMCDASLYEAFAPSGGAWAGPKQFRSSEYLLRTDVRDKSLPLHLAIAGGCAHLATRMLQCRPDLASEEAILLAFIKDQLETVEVLLDLRTTLPALTKPVYHARRQLENGYVWRFPVGFLVDLLARNDTNGLCLLARFGTGPDDFEGRQERDADSTISERAMRSAMQRATLANATLALDLFPWFVYPRLLDDVADKGFFSLVRSLHERGVVGSRDAMDKAAANGHLAIVRLLHSQRHEGCTLKAMTAAAINGHLEVVRFLDAHRNEGCTTRAMDEAAANGHLEVVQFLHFNRTEGCTYKALDGAITKGHLDVVRFLLEYRSEGASRNILNQAAGNGHLHVVQYLHDLGSFGCTVAAVDSAIAGGHLDVVQYLFAHRREGCSRDDAVAKALQNGHLQMATYLLSLGYPFPTSAIRWYVSTLRKPEMVDVLRLYIDNGGALDAYCILYACGAHNLPLVQLLHAHPSEFSGANLIEMAIKTKAWDVVAFLLAHSATASVLLQALELELPSSHLELVMQLLERQPELRDDRLLQVALGGGNVEAMRRLLALGIGNPRECLREIAGRREHVSESKLLLPYCMHPTDHLNNVIFLFDLLALLDRHRKTTFRLIAQELSYQEEMASEAFARAPNVAARASTLLEAGEVIDWSLAVVICQRWTTDATASIEQLEKSTALVHDAELQTQLDRLLTAQR
ncbi:hypothetical protein SDRG_08586 [Saprolegnia diclina VS20]|uniref:Uncharacterized protein n=1 Tax=Saprolegnia diclina (strain VS20) TaxID=1156394 RepID=T0QGP3_SAPDV|nr:hypothetical protein SDRG_08586 [Saprolegnia diclina VS20]EQC33906.1 hypothetical protein SDRG_08586 [Saprolegnia diclina VS20]|eukprot:XP_008612701.1 hypothetical protein SDRG_08586 [Saprolegnia diclina VS20]